MIGKFVLRDYKKADLEAIFQLDEICFSEEFRFDREAMRKFVEDKNALAHIAEISSGEIAGFVIAHIQRAGSQTQAYVVTLDVAPDYRRRGLAGRLMRKVEASALAAGARRIQLHVFTGNHSAIRFYERLDYERIRVARGYYGAAGLDAAVYRKDIFNI